MLCKSEVHWQNQLVLFMKLHKISRQYLLSWVLVKKQQKKKNHTSKKVHNKPGGPHPKHNYIVGIDVLGFSEPGLRQKYLKIKGDRISV